MRQGLSFQTVIYLFVFFFFGSETSRFWRAWRGHARSELCNSNPSHSRCQRFRSPSDPTTRPPTCVRCQIDPLLKSSVLLSRDGWDSETQTHSRIFLSITAKEQGKGENIDGTAVLRDECVNLTTPGHSVLARYGIITPFHLNHVPLSR